MSFVSLYGPASAHLRCMCHHVLVCQPSVGFIGALLRRTAHPAAEETPEAGSGSGPPAWYFGHSAGTEMAALTSALDVGPTSR